MDFVESEPSSAPLLITFVVPVLRETDSLRTTVETIARVAADHLHEVLIVTAERSPDESLQAARQLQADFPEVVRIHTQRLPELGGAVREAFELASGSHVMLMASDLETDPELIPRFIEKMQEGRWDIVCGSRWITGGGFDGYGCVRLLSNWLFQRCFRLLYHGRLTDLTFAYRLYRREVLQGIRWEEVGYPFLLECLLKPLRLGARAAEVPCHWRCRREGRSAGSFRQMLQYAPLAVRVRLMRRDRIRSEID